MFCTQPIWNTNNLYYVYQYGALDRSRTCMLFRAREPKSRVTANFTTRALFGADGGNRILIFWVEAKGTANIPHPHIFDAVLFESTAHNLLTSVNNDTLLFRFCFSNLNTSITFFLDFTLQLSNLSS